MVEDLIAWVTGAVVAVVEVITVLRTAAIVVNALVDGSCTTTSRGSRSSGGSYSSNWTCGGRTGCTLGSLGTRASRSTDVTILTLDTSPSRCSSETG